MGRVKAILAAAIVFTAVTALPAPADAKVSVKRGARYGARIFPSNAFTVRDRRQVTGRRVNFRRGVDFPTVAGRRRRRCTKKTYSICDGFAALNKLDGFDLQPLVTVPFTGPIRLDSVNDANFYISDRRGQRVSGLWQLTFDPRTNTLAGISEQFLREGTTYRIHVTSGIRDKGGRPVRACRRECVVPFTTRTASGILVRIRKALDAAQPRELTFTLDGKDTVFSATGVPASVAGPLEGIVRTNQVKADPASPESFESEAVPNLIPPGAAGYFAFGSFRSPRYQYASPQGHHDKAYGQGDGYTDGEIPPVPSKRTPKPFGDDRIGVIAVTPDPAMFPPPWPVAIYGPGFTRSKYDIFVSADYNASRGILTIATDPAGHAYGPNSTTTVTSNGQEMTFLSYGRGRDLNGDGEIEDGLEDGVGPTGHVVGKNRELPSRKAVDGLRSGLIQTVVDNMTLARAVKGGLDIPGVGKDLGDADRIYYYGISFGGIYGTMLMGTDPLVKRGLLNVPGGPIVDIARLSAFRGDLADNLKRSRPSFLNGGPGLDGFTEDLPLPSEPPRVIEHRGAFELQELFSTTNWYDRPGSPETFAPRIRLRPDPAWAKTPKEFAFQTAYGDGTVPNPTAATLYRAGELFDRVALYRNDKSPTFDQDPHGFLADPTKAGRTSGQQQLAEFLATGQLTNTNPSFFEVPIADPNNLECLHYPDPQTGEEQVREPYPASGECDPPPGG
jgi:hypothetical protein